MLRNVAWVLCQEQGNAELSQQWALQLSESLGGCLACHTPAAECQQLLPPQCLLQGNRVNKKMGAGCRVCDDVHA